MPGGSLDTENSSVFKPTLEGDERLSSGFDGKGNGVRISTLCVENPQVQSPHFFNPINVALEKRRTG